MDTRNRDEWQIWIDTGGTFTDCLAVAPSGALRRAKVLSSSALRGVLVDRGDGRRLRVRSAWDAPQDFVRGFRFCMLEGDSGERTVARYDPRTGRLELDSPLPPGAAPGAAFEVVSPEEAPLLAARLVTATPLDGPLPPLRMRLATTRGTNALLTRGGAPVALFITRGFGDLPVIGDQQRPDLFALDIRRPPPLYQAVVKVAERLAADGTVLQPFQPDQLEAEARRLLAQGIQTAAVAFLHGYRNPRHEQEAADILRRVGFTHVSCSSDLAPFIRLLPRTQTAIVNAYLAPIVGGYLERVRAALPDTSTLHVMTSAGGLTPAAAFRAKDSLLSGPAGGVGGAAQAGRQSGYPQTIAFDMGGTSTDVARYDGDYEYVFEHEVGGTRLVAPALAIESVAAGGGSICALDRQGLRVGPESAGASPGPACYGAGGPLTLTDVNLLLGRLSPDRFEIPLDRERAAAQAARLREALAQQTGEHPDLDALLEGFLEIANERMADAIRSVSLRRGYDPADYALVAFGGAGGQHACAVAARLGIRTVIVPADAGLLSALGIGYARIERFAERQALMPLEQAEGLLPDWIAALTDQALDALEAEGIARHHTMVRRRIVNLRLIGQDTSLSLEYDTKTPLADAFLRRYAAVYGHRPEGRGIEMESLRVVVSSLPEEESRQVPAVTRPADEAVSRVSARFEGVWVEVPAYERENLTAGVPIPGPVLIFERHSAIVIEAGWTGSADNAGAIILQQSASSGAQATALYRPAAVQEELFTSRFRAIAGEMGGMLQRTALSTNVKERLDFSCALLDADGELVVNAPHIPVHLGALGLCVRSVREAIAMQPGDVIVTNHPAYGGSHLPDVTVITPVHTRGGALLGYVASRAHHAEIGGMRPGSMPPTAINLAEEGVVIPPMPLIRKGRGRWATLRRILNQGPYPSRSIEDNLADLRAAVAANYRGANALAALAEIHGEETVRRHMEALKARAERMTREALRGLPGGRYEAVERLDDGSLLAVTITLTGGQAHLNFTGSAPTHPGSLNATPAIVRSAVLYVLRLLLREPLPLNEGIMRAVTLHIPPGILNPDFPADPARCPAVVGGNVETSQRLVDTLLKALGLAACSQGTMNNVLWGTEQFGYYETVCGGAGAGPGFDGASAVHTHMTNTRITDPEIVEHRYPVRLERFAIRRGSGGNGRWRGGDGVVREYTFLEPMSLSLLTQHRVERPYGLYGGDPGLPGRQRLLRTDGETIELGAIDGCEAAPGDRLLLETPGGGGYGE